MTTLEVVLNTLFSRLMNSSKVSFLGNEDKSIPEYLRVQNQALS